MQTPVDERTTATHRDDPFDNRDKLAQFTDFLQRQLEPTESNLGILAAFLPGPMSLFATAGPAIADFIGNDIFGALGFEGFTGSRGEWERHVAEHGLPGRPQTGPGTAADRAINGGGGPPTPGGGQAGPQGVAPTGPAGGGAVGPELSGGDAWMQGLPGGAPAMPGPAQGGAAPGPAMGGQPGAGQWVLPQWNPQGAPTPQWNPGQQVMPQWNPGQAAGVPQWGGFQG